VNAVAPGESVKARDVEERIKDEGGGEGGDEEYYTEEEMEESGEFV